MRARERFDGQPGVAVALGTMGWVACASVVGVGRAVVVALVLAMGGALVARDRIRRGQRMRKAAVADLIELFVVSASAGLPVASSLVAVAPRAPVVLQPSLARAVTELERGLSLAVVLDRLREDLGERSGALVDALARSAITGVALLPLLEHVAGAARDARRRDAQEAARRLPVTMLFPLAGCILPAAIVLAVVPVLVVSLASLTS